MCLAEFSPPDCKVFFCDVLEFIINFVPKVFGDLVVGFRCVFKSVSDFLPINNGGPVNVSIVEGSPVDIL